MAVTRVEMDSGGGPLSAVEFRGLALRRGRAAVRECTTILRDEERRLLRPHNRTRAASRGLFVMTPRLVGSQIIGAVGSFAEHFDWLDKGTGIYGPRKRPIVPRVSLSLRFPVTNLRSRYRTASGRRSKNTAMMHVQYVKGQKAQNIVRRAEAATVVQRRLVEQKWADKIAADVQRLV